MAANCGGQVLSLFNPISLSSCSASEDQALAWPFDPPILHAASHDPKQRSLVCVNAPTSLLGLHILEELLLRGYSVRLTVATQEEVEEIKGHVGDSELIESVAMADMSDLVSLCHAFMGCEAVFLTSSFIDPQGISGYSEQMALLETKGAENMLEACGRVGSVKKCIFTSSLLACVWQRSEFSGVINEKYWSDQELCREKKLWLALGKTMAEKAAWSKSQEMRVKLVSICHGLLTAPLFPSAYDAAAIAYLKGGQAMLKRHLLATADVKKVAKAQILIFEAMDEGAAGRYLCFDRVLTNEDEVIQLEHKLKMHGLLSTSTPGNEDGLLQRRCLLSNAKTTNLLSHANIRCARVNLRNYEHV